MGEEGGFDPRLGIEARNLTHMVAMGKEIEEKYGYKLTDPNGEPNRVVVAHLVKAKEEIEREDDEKSQAKEGKAREARAKEDDTKEYDYKLIKHLKKYLREAYKANEEIAKKREEEESAKKDKPNKEEKDDKKPQEQQQSNQTEALEREMLSAANELRREMESTVTDLKSRTSTDSETNDLRILEDMAHITMLASELSMQDVKTAEVGRQAIQNIAVTTGGASLDQAATRQAIKANTESFDKSLAVNLDAKTRSVNINTMPVSEAPLETNSGQQQAKAVPPEAKEVAPSRRSLRDHFGDQPAVVVNIDKLPMTREAEERKEKEAEKYAKEAANLRKKRYGNEDGQ